MARIPSVADVVGLLQQQTEALVALPSTLLNLTTSVRQLSETVSQARDTAAAVQRLAVRMDALVEELEEPVRALAPGLRRLAVALDDPVIETIPDTLRTVTDEVLPIVQGLRETQQKVAVIANSTDRIMGFVDDTSTRLTSLPGAALLGRRRSGSGWGAAGTGASTVAQPGAAGTAGSAGVADGAPDAGHPLAEPGDDTPV